jgi:hypothetical protein
MSYEGSLYWSSYDSTKENIEYEFRMKMYSIIEEEIKEAVASGLPHTYIDGMEYAKSLVLDTQREKTDTVSQPTLL